MARPIKKGLDYFPLDVDWDQDRKLRWIIRKYKAEALAVIPAILREIYSDEGYFVEASDRFFEDVAYSTYTEIETVRAIVADAIDSGFFNRDKFEEHGVLTSHGIQERYLTAKKVGNATAQLREVYRLTSTVSSEKTPVSSEETRVNSEETPINSESIPQSKVKKSIVYNINNIINKQTNKQTSAREENSSEGSGDDSPEAPEGIDSARWLWAREIIKRRIWERGISADLIDFVTLAGVLGWLNQDTITEWLQKSRHEKALFEESRGRVGRSHRWETIRSELAILYGEHGETLPTFSRQNPEPAPDLSKPPPERPRKTPA